MIPMTADELAKAANGELLVGDGNRRVDAVTIDSRKVPPGACFVAIVGERHDGHDFLEPAAAAGATALIVHRRRAPETPSLGNDIPIILVEDTTHALQAIGVQVRQLVDPLVVAITGSVGKTTTKDLTAALVSTRFEVHASPGNLNNHWGLPLSLIGLEAGHRVMVAELAMSGPGEILRLTELAAPQIGVIINVAPVHMEFFPDLDAVAEAKAELAAGLASTGTLIVNADDRHTAAIGERFAPSVRRVLTFGRSCEAQIGAQKVLPSAQGFRFTLQLPDEASVSVELPLPGEHSLDNFLAAAAAAHALGIPAGAIAERAPSLALPAMRGGLCKLDGGVTLIDDSYNASPVAMMRALENLAATPTSGRRIAVTGDMLELGRFSDEAHREVGIQAARLGIDVLVAVGELGVHTAAGATETGMPESAILRFSGSDEASTAIAEATEPGDLILVKGSRAVHMERVVEALVAALGVASAAPGADSFVEAEPDVEEAVQEKAAEG